MPGGVGMLDSMETVRMLIMADEGGTLPGGSLHVAYLIAVKMLDLDPKKREYRITEKGREELRFWRGYLWGSGG